MRLGMHLRELWGLRAWAALGVALAVLAALATVYRVGLFPPSLQSRSLDIGAAHTRVVVDTPKSKVVDLDAGTADFNSLATRTSLLANVMVSEPVKAMIARRLGVSADRVVARAPIIANVPRQITEPGAERSAGDILAQTNQYRLYIEANPQVPILNIHAQGPSQESAKQLADGAVSALREYLGTVAARQSVPHVRQVRLEQLGRAQGRVVNDGAGLQLALLAFAVVLALSWAAMLACNRVLIGWRLAPSR